MKLQKKDMLLYAVTDRSWLNGKSLYEEVHEAIMGGATMIQLREKNLDEESFLAEAKQIKELCARYHIPLIINDNIDIALKINADGVHVGQDDINVQNARKILGPNKIIGVSAHNVSEAVAAVDAGADYLGTGAVFPTGSKKDVTTLEKRVLKEICETVDVPVTAIGGINEKNIIRLTGTGISGVAVISAIFAADNITKKTQELKELAQKVVVQ